MALHPYKSQIPQITSPSQDHPLLLAFLGQRAVGKTSLAKWAAGTYGGEVMSFATALKLEVYDLLAATDYKTPYVSVSAILPDCSSIKWTDLPIPRLVLPSKQEKLQWIDANKASLSKMIQEYGTEYRRAQDDRYWINPLADKIVEFRLMGANAIYVDDVRFRSEAQALKDLGFNLVRVNCGTQEQIDRATIRDSSFDISTLQHQSERDTLYTYCDYIIDNSGPLHESTSSLNHAILHILNR